jgi:ABC-type multidrug transport system fused ATPase/permease subunit
MLVALVAVQVLLSGLDLLGVLLIGVVAGLSAAALTGGGDELAGVLPFPLPGVFISGISGLLLLAGVSGLLLISKSILGFYLMHRSYRFLAFRQAQISSKLAAEVLRRPLLEVQRRTSQEIAYALTMGVSAASMGVLGNGVLAIVELSVSLVLLLGLLAIDPIVGAFTTAFFAIISWVIHWYLSHRGRNLGSRLSAAEIGGFSGIQSALRVFREVVVTGRRDFFTERFQQVRWEAAAVQADVQSLSQLAKYTFEIALIVGAAGIAVSQFVTRGAIEAIAIIAVFLAAASRILPALLRLQGAIFNFRTSSGVAETTLQFAAELRESPAPNADETSLSGRCLSGLARGYPGFSPEIELRQVSLTYPECKHPAVSNVSLHVPPGSSLALVGPSGAGKTSLVDIMLGVLQPGIGDVWVSGVRPSEAVSRWPGAIAYLPQDVYLVDGSLRDNVALGLPADLIDDSLVLEALDRAHLSFEDLRRSEGLDTHVGEAGVRLSGGQRQRLGLARTFFTRPRLIILDEATSSMDAETEFLISQTLRELHGQVTLVIIAHRLSTVRDSDQVAYLEAGKLKALGTFEEVKATQTNFARQAHLLGL